MSKLFEKYKILKLENSSKLYLFKSGIFYIFLDNDAIEMSKLLNLKLTNLNETVVKCGFPVKNANKYLNLIKLNNYELDIIDSINSPSYSNNTHLFNDNAKKFINDIANIDYCNLSVSEAFTLLETLATKAKQLLNNL